MKKIGAIFFEIVGLSTPRGRILFVAIITVLVYCTPAKWPVTVSVWQQLHIPSPSIGLTRAYRQLLHADFVGAWQQNKLIYAVVAVIVPLLFRDILRIAKKPPVSPGIT